jgi:hypothetical protein
MFSVYLISPPAIDSGAYSAFNRNEYQSQKNTYFLGSDRKSYLNRRTLGDERENLLYWVPKK